MRFDNAACVEAELMDAALAGGALLRSSPSPSWGLSTAADCCGGALAGGVGTGGVWLAAAETDIDMEDSG